MFTRVLPVYSDGLYIGGYVGGCPKYVGAAPRVEKYVGGGKPTASIDNSNEGAAAHRV